MKNAALVLAVAGLVTASGCGKKVPPPSPTVAPTPPPPAPMPAEAEQTEGLDEYARLKGMSAEEIDRLNLLADIPFDFDRYDIRTDARPLLARNAEVLRRFDFLGVTIEGHCDDRGTVEYNLALGERRARAAYDYLVSLGVPAARLLTTSLGKEAPTCSESTEACWARNRRARFKVTGNAGRN